MEETNKQGYVESPLRLLRLSLIEISFMRCKIDSTLESIPIEAISLMIEIKRLDALTLLSICHIEISTVADFKFSSIYEVESQTKDTAHTAVHENFARIGAMFNAMVHAREALNALTSKAFGRMITFPLLNILDFGRDVQIKSRTEISPEVTSTGEIPSPPPSPEK